MRRTCGREEKYHCPCTVQTSRYLTALCARPRKDKLSCETRLEGFNFPGSRGQAVHQQKWRPVSLPPLGNEEWLHAVQPLTRSVSANRAQWRVVVGHKFEHTA
jgi:hypothetical protein